MQGAMARAKKGTGDYQIYSNLTIILKTPEPDFGRSFSTIAVSGVDPRADRPHTADGGKTWTIRRVVIPPMNPGTSARPGSRPDREDDRKEERRQDRIRNIRKMRWFFSEHLLQQ